MSAAFSPIKITAALVLPLTTFGVIEASTTRKPDTPCTRNSWIDHCIRRVGIHSGGFSTG